MPSDKFDSLLSERTQLLHTNFAQNIKEARRARGWTQQEAAERCLLSRNAYRNAEEGRLGTAIGVYWVILDVFDLSSEISELASPHSDIVARASMKVSLY